MRKKNVSKEDMQSKNIQTALASLGNKLKTRKLIVEGSEINIYFISQIVDRAGLSSSIIKPILNYCGNTPLTLETIASSVLYVDDIVLESNIDSLTDYILDGYAIITDMSCERYIAANIRKIEKRNISGPQLQEALKTPRDAFIEDLESNLSLIQNRIKDPSLVIENYTIGRRSQTKVAVIYLKDVANPIIIDDLRTRLNSIDVDGIIQSGYIQKFLQKGSGKLFPRVGTAERSESACADILDGKIIIMANGSNLALTIPHVFVEFIDSGDDHYDNIYICIFNKLLRYFAVIFTLILSPLYIIIVAFHPDFLPPNYILALAVSRATVPINAFVEAFLMELAAELLREATIRLPKQIGPAIGIVGTIVVGEAAVSAGIVSPLMVIIISLATLSSFSIPDFTIMNSIRILKFALIIITGFLGLFGLVMGLTAVMIALLSATSFGVPYLSPIVPFNFKDLKNYLISDVKTAKTRPEYVETKDKTRQK